MLSLHSIFTERMCEDLHQTRLQMYATDAVPIHSEDPVEEKDARNQAVPIDSRIKSGAKSRSRRRRTRGRRSKNKIKAEGRMIQANFCKQINNKNLYCDSNQFNALFYLPLVLWNLHHFFEKLSTILFMPWPVYWHFGKSTFKWFHIICTELFTSL